MSAEKDTDIGDKARASALASLALREHSAFELQQKLLRKDMPETVVVPLIAQLQKQNLLSDARFSEVYWRQRAARGFGPIKIAYELQHKGVDEATIAEGRHQAEVDFEAGIKEVYLKKYADNDWHHYSDKAKRQNFLYRRGFPHELIKMVVA